MSQAAATKPDTKQRILDAAERLIAREGFEGASLRRITGEARVNLAAVNYHFQSKESLLKALFERRIGPVNAARLQLLGQVEAESAGGALPLERVLEAFLRPVLLNRTAIGSSHIRRFMGRLYSQPGDWFQEFFLETVGEVARRFQRALLAALPGCRPVEAAWAFQFTVGVMANFLGMAELAGPLSGGLCDVNDAEGVLRRMVRYCAAGIRGLAAAEELQCAD